MASSARERVSIVRNTSQRQLILNFLKTSNAHPKAEQIYKTVKRSLPHISLGTVYRNLKVLEEQGDISSLSYSKDYTRYEARTDTHYHFICSQCDKVIEVELAELLDINEQVAKRHQVAIEQHRLYFFGLCQDCLRIT